jgi:hypothetical protein
MRVVVACLVRNDCEDAFAALDHVKCVLNEGDECWVA